MKTVFRFLKPYRGRFFLTVFFMIADVACGLVIPTLTADMINIGVGSRDMNYVLEKGLIMAAVTVLAGASALAGSWLCARLSADMGRDMRNALYEKSLELSMHDFEQLGTGSMITRTLNDVSVIQQSVVWCIQMVLPVPALSVMGIVMAFAIDRGMGLMLTGIVFFVTVLAFLVGSKASAIFERMQKFLDRMNVVLRENLTGVRVIRAFNKEEYEAKRMRKSFGDYASAAIRTNQLFAGLDCISYFVINVCIVGILWIGGNQIGLGRMEIGDITAMTEYTILILFYLMMAQMVIILLPRASVCLERLNEVLEKKPEIQDGLEQMGGKSEHGEEVIRMEKVNFSFPDTGAETLHEISFSCRKGETTAIIGGTGSGKSTIVRLLLRFHDVTEGAVLLNGKDVRTICQKELREHISYVPQKAWLFSGTIEDNLRSGSPGAGEEEMYHALEVAQAGFVKKLDDGLRAHVAQGGTNFSGGQKQRLSIARALMKKADLYIFDDSFSALDFKTDHALRTALADEMKEAAVLIVAQRISTIRHASQILVLEEGRIAGSGTHEELMENCQVYREIAASQRKGGGEHGQ